MRSPRHSCQILRKTEFSQKISEKYSNIKFHENPILWEPSCSMRADGRAEMTKLTVAFRNFANARPWRTADKQADVTARVQTCRCTILKPERSTTRQHMSCRRTVSVQLTAAEPQEYFGPQCHQNTHYGRYPQIFQKYGRYFPKF